MPAHRLSEHARTISHAYDIAGSGWSAPRRTISATRCRRRLQSADYFEAGHREGFARFLRSISDEYRIAMPADADSPRASRCAAIRDLVRAWAARRADATRGADKGRSDAGVEGR